MVAHPATARSQEEPATTVWVPFLSTLEARTEAWRKHLDDSGPAPAPLAEWPKDLGPCPPHLRTRARHLLVVQQDLEHEIRARRDALAALLNGTRTAIDDSVPNTSLYVDFHA